MVTRQTAIIDQIIRLKYLAYKFTAPETKEAHEIFEYEKIEIWYGAPDDANSELYQTILPASIIHTAGTNVYEYDVNPIPSDKAGMFYDKHFYIPVEGFNTITDTEEFSVSCCIDDEIEEALESTKVGWTFKNYQVPTGTFGEVVTYDDILYTGLYGIPKVALDGQEIQKEQIQEVVEWAVAEVERWLNIDIRRRKRVCEPSDDLIQVTSWDENPLHYTDEADPYDFDPATWRNYGYLQLDHYPVINVSKFDLYSYVDSKLIDLMSWIRLKKQYGQLGAYPKIQTGQGGNQVFPFIGGQGLYIYNLTQGYPSGIKVDYETGFKSAEFVPQDIRSFVMDFAVINTLAWVGDGLLAGFSSSSVSIDGISESFSSTQSATSAYFGARIQQLTKRMTRSMDKLKRKYSNMPIGFA